MADQKVWGIHAGKTGDADTLFLEKNVVALGWKRIPDPSKLPADRESFKKALADAYPDTKPGGVPVQAGQIFRFAHEMAVGDIIVYPSKRDKKIHIGRIEGEYRHDAALGGSYPNLRSVKWEKSVSRTHFSQGALYETGSALSLFEVKNFADEFLAELEGRLVPQPVEKDPTVSLVSEDIEQTTQDFILKTLAQELKGHPFADFIGHLLNQMDYRTRVSPPGPDAGIDIIAHKDELGFEPPIIKVQVKSTEGTVGDPVVSALYGKVEANEFGLLITLGTYSNQAIGFARNKSNLRLIDGEELVQLVLAHYEEFDSEYKAILPLKQVFIPKSVDQE